MQDMAHTVGCVRPSRGVDLLRDARPSSPWGCMTPYNMLFGQEVRTHFHNIELDGPSLGEGLERTVADRQRMVPEVQQAFAKRKPTKDRRRHKRTRRG